MSKTVPFMTVELKLDRDDVEYAAECIVDDLYDDFDSEAFEALGLQYRDFLNEVIDMYEFSQMVRQGVEKNGPEALNDPYDYMNFDIVTRSPQYRKVVNVIEMLQEVINDAYKHERNQASNPCEEAIKTLQAAGFKIVKA